MSTPSINALKGLLLLALLSTMSCSDKNDSDETTATPKNVNEWIAATMRKWYYWYDEIPSDKTLNYNNTPELFYQSLLSPQDGKNSDGKSYHYSTIKPLKAMARGGVASDLSIGIGIQLWRLSRDPIIYSANVMYVLPGSPAERAGLVRGNWIHTIDEAPLTLNNVSKLYGTTPITLGWGATNTSSPADKLELLTPERLNDTPVLYHTIIEEPETNFKKVGYLVYLHFSPNPEGENSKVWDKELEQAIGNMKRAGVDEMILDLRYNGGGLVTSAQCLASLLAPQNSLGKRFCRVRYNDVVKQQYDYNLNHNDNTLSLSQLFVLTSNQTASASEAVINGLRPFYPVTLIGEVTEGKNVGSVTFTEKKFGWEIHPIVCKIYNANEESDYANGFIPNYEISGNKRALTRPTPLGDYDNDLALKVALQYVRGESPVPDYTRNSKSEEMQLIATPQPKVSGFILPHILVD